MNTPKGILIGLALAGLLGAQEASTEQKPAARQTRVFQVKYADVRDLEHVLDIFGYGMKANPDLHVLAVSAPPDAMNAIEDAIKRLDVPTASPKDIDLTAYLVVASEQPDGSAPLPPDLQAVTRELKGIFAYKSFHLLDTVLLRTQTGNSAHTKGVIAGGLAENPKTPYEFTVRPTLVTEDPAGRLIRLDLLNLELFLSGGGRAGINTEISVREGQKVVVGKSNMGSPGQALILVVTAKIAG
jgi:Bacterial type II/III secretion system short domain